MSGHVAGGCVDCRPTGGAGAGRRGARCLRAAPAPGATADGCRTAARRPAAGGGVDCTPAGRPLARAAVVHPGRGAWEGGLECGGPPGGERALARRCPAGQWPRAGGGGSGGLRRYGGDAGLPGAGHGAGRGVAALVVAGRVTLPGGRRPGGPAGGTRPEAGVSAGAPAPSGPLGAGGGGGGGAFGAGGAAPAAPAGPDLPAARLGGRARARPGRCRRQVRTPRGIRIRRPSTGARAVARRGALGGGVPLLRCRADPVVRAGHRADGVIGHRSGVAPPSRLGPRPRIHGRATALVGMAGDS